MLAGNRLPLEPLVRLISASFEGNGSVYAHGYRHGQHVSRVAFANHLGYERSVVYKWDKGGIPLHTADRIARDLGLHLLNIWPDAYDDITEDGVKVDEGWSPIEWTGTRADFLDGDAA